MNKPEVQTCYSPALYDLYHDPEAIVVIVDVLRATSAICTAIHHGVKMMVPVAGIEAAMAYKSRGFLVACERDAIKQDGFDFGNSPLSFITPEIQGKTIAISTTNGTQAIEAAKKAATIVIGSFLNLSALSNWLIHQNKKVVILCAGWKNRYNMEDTLFAGALSKNLIESGAFYTHCDASISAAHLYQLGGNDLFGFLENSSHRKRLQNLHLEDDIRFCLQLDYTAVIPVFKEEGLIDMQPEVHGISWGRNN